MKKLTCIWLTVFIIFSTITVSSCGSNNEKDIKGTEFDPKNVAFHTSPEQPTEKPPEEKKKEKETVPKKVKVVPSSELAASKYKKLVSSYDSLLSSRGFRGEVFVTEHNKPIYNKGIDYADKKKKIKIDENTVFRIASITKQFTAAAIMILQERGLLSTKDKISKYFPDYKHGDKITIDHLLRMRSGIPDYLKFYNNVASLFPSKSKAFKSDSKTNRKIIMKAFMDDDLLFTPGATFKYSNSGYLLLGEIVEMVSKTTYEDFVQKEIFDKLGMENTGFVENLKGKKYKNIARPYNSYEGQTDIFKIKGAAFACGNMYSTAVDLNKWAWGLTHYKVMSKETFKAMVSDKSHVGYAYGLFTLDGGRVVYHTGSLCPYNGIIIMSLGNTEYTCIVLSNSNYYTADQVGKSLRSTYAGMF